MIFQYVVCAPGWSETNGGAIFLHRLVHTLNDISMSAALFPMEPVYRRGVRARLKKIFSPDEYKTNPSLETPIARQRDIGAETIVVYPELVKGNPLGARSVVRWLLYRPGRLHPYEFGKNEMYFRAGEMSDLPELTGGAPELTMWQVNRTYQNEGRTDRSGTAYIVRKGFDKPRLPETETSDAICVDRMSHEEMNRVFNRVETFISYDEATMYSQYAAVCGCLSIVVPGLFKNRQEWVKNHPMGRFGVAYGFDDQAHAISTRDKVLPMLEAEESKGVESVRRFVELTKARFGG